MRNLVNIYIYIGMRVKFCKVIKCLSLLHVSNAKES